MKRTGRKILFGLCVFLSVFFVWFVVAETYSYEVDTVDYEIKLSNIRIIPVHHYLNDSTGGTSYGVGSSGTLIGRVDTVYYVLTAAHVINQNEDTSYIVLTENDQSIQEYLQEDGEFMGIERYYSRFPALSIVAIDEAHDLALASFKSTYDLPIRHLASSSAQRGDPVIIVSNPEGQHGVVSSGRMLGSKPQLVRFDKESAPVAVIKHNAETNFGSSGSAVLNTAYEIVGLNIGGKKIKFFDMKLSFFDRGYAVPLDTIKAFVIKTGLDIIE